MTYRECTKCGETKPLADFYRAKLGLHGRMAWCKACDGARRREYDVANKDKVRAQVKAWMAKNRNKMAASSRRFRRRHPERVAATGKQYRRANPAKRTFWQMTREARKKRAIPPWADLEKIKMIYQNCPPGHHVDHIIPLVAMRGREQVASGLHCEANLQYLPAAENAQKWASMLES